MLSRSTVLGMIVEEEIPAVSRYAVSILSHPQGFSILVADDLVAALSNISEHTLAFHGSEFSFNRPKKKHKGEYTRNFAASRAIFKMLDLTVLAVESNPPLRRHSNIIFMPIATSARPLYIYPWLSTSSSIPPALPKVKEFVMASCLFGGSIIGIDPAGNQYPLIDHNLKVSDMIIEIVVDPAMHPYEVMSLAALEGLFPLMAQISDKPIFVRYHLPVIDYMLYGLYLYIGGKITFDALEKFVQQVKIRGSKHKEIIQRLAQKSNIIMHVESPFDNLFTEEIDLSARSLLSQFSLSLAQIERMKTEYPILSCKLALAAQRSGHKIDDFKSIIDILNAWEEAPAINEDQAIQKKPRELFEELCIENILDCLTKNNEFSEYNHIWNEIITGGEVSRFSPLQQLFKLANVAFIARSSRARSAFEVCSLLPIDEEPIAQSYKEVLSEKLGHILCLSWLPPLLSYINYKDTDIQKESHLNNLFRFRPDKFSVDICLVKKSLTSYFGLTEEFWNIVNHSCAAKIFELNVNLEKADISFFQTAYPGEGENQRALVEKKLSAVGFFSNEQDKQAEDMKKIYKGNSTP